MSAISWVAMAKETGRREARAAGLLEKARDARRAGLLVVADEFEAAARARRAEAERLHGLAVAGFTVCHGLLLYPRARAVLG